MTPLLRPLPEAPWPWLIGLYFILAGIAAGTTLIAEWLQPEDERAAVAFTWRMNWLSLFALVLCGVILIVDLGRPARFFLMVTSFANFGSAMSVGAKLIACKGALLVGYLYLLWRRRRALASGDTILAPGLTQTVYSAVPVLLAIASLCLAVYPAILLARTWSSPLAASAGAGLLFVSTALVMGAALATVLTRDSVLLARLRSLMLFLAGAQLCLLPFAGLALYDSTPAQEHALQTLVRGQAAVFFWGLVIGVGLLLPGVTLLARSRHGFVILCGFCLLVGAATLRFLVFSVA